MKYIVKSNNDSKEFDTFEQACRVARNLGNFSKDPVLVLDKDTGQEYYRSK